MKFILEETHDRLLKIIYGLFTIERDLIPPNKFLLTYKKGIECKTRCFKIHHTCYKLLDT